MASLIRYKATVKREVEVVYTLAGKYEDVAGAEQYGARLHAQAAPDDAWVESYEIETEAWLPPEAIVADGSQDVTSALQGFFEDAGPKIELPAEAQYRCENTVVIHHRGETEIIGNGATIFATTPGDRNRSHLEFRLCEDITLRTLKIGGAFESYNQALEAQHAFYLSSSKNIELDRVSARQVYGDFVYVGAYEHPSRNPWCDGVWVHDSTFTRSGRQGWTVAAGRNVIFERSDLRGQSHSTIDLEAPSGWWGAENIHILDNTLGPGNNMALANKGEGDQIGPVVFRGNTLERPLLVRILTPEGHRRSGFFILDNTSTVETRGGEPPIWLVHVDTSMVAGNRQPLRELTPDSDGRYGVRLHDACGVLVGGNDWGADSRGRIPETIMTADGQNPTAPYPTGVPAPPAFPGRTA